MRALRYSKPRPLSVSLARFSSALAFSAAMVGAAQAANYYFDADQTAAGNSPAGAGLGVSANPLQNVWDTGTQNWWNGSSDVVWPNSNLNTAIFGGTGGAITLGAPITVGNLLFQSSGYSLLGSGANTLTFGATNGIINFNERTGAALNATIGAKLAGNSGFTFNGNGGTLLLNSTTQQGLTGTMTIRSGTIKVNDPTGTAFPGSAGLGLTFNGSGRFIYDNVGAAGALNGNGLGALNASSGDGVVQIERTVNSAVTLNFSSFARSAGSSVLFLGNSTAATNESNTRFNLNLGAGFVRGAFVKYNTNPTTMGVYVPSGGSGTIQAISYIAGNNDLGATSMTAGRHVQLGAASTPGTISILSLALTSTNALTLTAGSTLTINDTAQSPSFGTILKTGGTAMTIGGTGTISTGGGELLVRPDSAADQITISAVIGSGVTDLTKSGDGTLILSGANAFSGVTYVNGGTLRISGTGAKGSGTSFNGVTLNGGTYEMVTTNDTAIATAKNLMVNGTGTINWTRSGTAVATNQILSFANLSIGNQVLTTSPLISTWGIQVTGTTTLRDALPATFNVTGTQAVGTTPGLTLTGAVSGSGGFIKRGSGTLVLSATNNNFGGNGAVVEVQGGLLSVASDTAFGATGTSVILNTLTGAEGLVVTGNAEVARSLTLAQANNSIEVTGANTLGWTGTISSPGVSNLIKRGTGTLRLDATNTFGGTGSTIDVQAGSLSVTSNGALGVAGNTVNLNNAGGKFTAAAPLSFAQNFTLGQAANGIEVTAGGGNNTLTLSGLISNTGTTAAGILKTGGGILELTNSGNSFGGVGALIDVQTGALQVSSGGALGNFNNTVKLTSGLFNATGTSTAYQAFNFDTSASPTVNVSAGNTFTLRGAVTGGSVTTLTKAGAGTLELTSVGNSGLGTGTWSINVTGGFLAASSNEALGKTTASTITLGAAGGGFLATGSFTLSGRILNLTANSNINVVDGATLTVDTAFSAGSDGRSITKGGAGRLTLGVNQTWTGALAINDGTVRITTPNALGGIATGSETTISGNGGLELAGGISSAEPLFLVNSAAPTTGNITLAGSSNNGVIRSVTGANTLTGAITVNNAPPAGGTRSIAIGVDSGATLNLVGPGSTNAIAFPSLAGTTMNLILGGDGTGSMTKTITATNGTVGIIKSGASTWSLQPTVAPAVGSVQVRSGTISLVAVDGNVGLLNASTNLAFNGGGTFNYNTTGGNKSQSLAALTFDSGDGTVLVSRSGSTVTTLSFTSLARTAGATGLFSGGTATGSVLGGSANALIKVTSGLSTSAFIDPGYFAVDTSLSGASTFAYYDQTTQSIQHLTYNGSYTPAVSLAGSGSALTANGGKHLQITGATKAGGTPASPLLSLHLATSGGAGGITVANGGTLTISSTGTVATGSAGLGAGGILKTGGDAATIGGALTTDVTSLSTGGTANELIVRTEVAGDNLTINSNIINTGALTKSGLGVLTLAGTNSWSGATSINGGSLIIQGAAALAGNTSLALNSGNFTFQENGDGKSSLETIYAGGSLPNVKNLTVAGGNSTISVSRTQSGLALNKTITFGTLDIGNQTLNITVANGYGVEFRGNTAMSSGLPTTFSVSGTQASDVVQGLTLSGVVSSTSAAKGLIKTGTGSLALTNAANSFGGAAGVIDIQGGILSANSNGALGDSLNDINLNVAGANGLTQGFRADGTFSTGRTFVLNQANNTIEVTQGNILTLTTGLSVPTGANTLAKNNSGILELGADSPAGWNGAITINGGAIRVSTTAGLGATSAHTITVTNAAGAALQLAGTNTTYAAYPVTLGNSGINSGGALENVSGTNTWTGAVTMSAASVIGSTSGTLNLTGGIIGGQALTFNGAGNINVTNTGLTAAVTAITKNGTGTTTLGVASSAFVGGLTINGGTFAIKGSGALIGGTGAIAVSPGATLRVDDSVGAATARLGGRVITLTSGTFRYDGNQATASAETLGAITIGSGQSYFITEPGAGQTTTLTLPTLGLNADSSIAFSGTSVGTRLNKVLVSNLTSPATLLVNNMIPRAVVSGADFATYIPDQTLVASSSSGQNTINLPAGTSTRLLVVGQVINADNSNGNIPQGAIITAITGPNQFLIDRPATGTGSTNTKFAATGIAAMNSEAYSNAIDITSTAVSATETFALTQSTVVANLLVSKTINALKITNNRNLGGAARTALTLGSGGLLSTGGNNSIDVPTLTFGAQAIVHVNAGSTLLIQSTLTGSAGFVKADGGTLILDSPSSAILGVNGNTALTGTHNINAGTVKLGATTGTVGNDDGNNMFGPGVALRMGSGATLDLNGHLQLVGALLTDSATSGVNGTLGKITSEAGAGALVANVDNNARNWSANITDGAAGTMSFSRSGQNTFSIYSPQTYSGITQINGGTTVLRDAAALSATSAIDLNFATLTLDNRFSNGSTTDSANRINDSATLMLRGATLNFNGREQSISTETLGAVTVGSGLSLIVPTAGGTGVNSATLTLASLAQQANSGGMVNFSGTTLGLIGSGNGRVLINSAPTLSNDLIGPWAIVATTSGADFASYNSGVGVGALGSTGYASYVVGNGNLTSYLAAQSPNANVKVTNFNGLTLPGAMNANTLNLAAIGNVTLNLGGILNLTGGGLIKSGNFAVTLNGDSLTAGGTATSGTTDLYVYNNQNTLTLTSKVIDTAGPTGSPTGGIVRLVVTNGNAGTTVMNASANTYKGGTVVNGGTLNLNIAGTPIPAATNPADGLVINGATVTMQTTQQQIAAANIVTLNGTSILNLVGNNTLAGLVFNNSGGTTAPTVNTFVTGTGTTNGTLTLGSAGVTATSSNITTTAAIVGRIDLAGPTPFVIDAIKFDGKSINPIQATLTVQGIGSTSGNGGIVKSGDGVLQINSQSTYTGATIVNGGGIQFGSGNAGSRFSAIQLQGANTRLNLNGASVAIGSLSGSGLVTNSSTTSATLTTGFDNANTVFSGQIRRIGDGGLTGTNITKIGTGRMDLTGAGSDSAGLLSIQGGEVRYSANAATTFGTNQAVTRGTLIIDNSAGAKTNRLGGTFSLGTLNVSGGLVNLVGNSAAGSSEQFANLTVGSGSGTIRFQPAGQSFMINIGNTINGVQSGASLAGIQAGGTLLVQGISSTSTINIGNLAFGAPTGFGVGNTEFEYAIRPDMIGDASSTGLGTSFLTNAPGGVLRLLEASQVQDTLNPGNTINAPTNNRLTTLQTIDENNVINSLVLTPGAKIGNALDQNFFGKYSPNGTLLTQTIISGGILATTGGTSMIDVGLLQTLNNASLIVHAVGTGNLTVAGDFAAGSGGLTKSGSGLLTLGGRGFYTGTTTVNDGTVRLTGPQDNAINVGYLASGGATGTAVSGVSALVVNGGTLDLNGHSQIFGNLTSNNGNAGAGGTITSATAATLTSSATTGGTFSGQITGDLLNFTVMRSGTNTLTLTSPQTYKGATVVRGGGLVLRDSASLASTSIGLNYATLTLDQTGLNPAGNLNPTRLASATNITMQGSTLTLTTGGAMDGNLDLSTGTITILGGANVFQNGSGSNVGSSSLMQLGNLVRPVGSTGTVNFTANGGTLGAAGLTAQNSQNPRTTIGNVTLDRSIIGPWAVVGGSEFASYVNGVGVVPLSVTGYDVTNSIPDSPNSNVRLTSTTAQTPSTNVTINTLTMSADVNILPTGTDTILNIRGGGIVRNASTTNRIGELGGNTGVLTAGGNSAVPASGFYDLFVHNNQGTLVINAKVTDNPNVSGGAVRFILNGGGTTQMTNGNDYTGGTVVNGGTLQLANTDADGSNYTPIPGDLTINNGATVTLQAVKQLRETAQVTLDGTATLNMISTNTIGKLVFNNRGGTGSVPTVGTALLLTLSAADAITSTNDTLATTPLINGFGLTFSDPNPTITTNGASPNSLQIVAPILSNTTPGAGPITKAGTGSLFLNPNVGTVVAATTLNSPTLTIADTSNYRVGMGVSGTGIQAGTFIIAVGANTVTLSTGATVTSTTSPTLAINGSLFTEGVNLSEGTLVFGASSNFGINPNVSPTAAVQSGPIGTGVLTIGTGTNPNGPGPSLLSDGTIRTIHNDVIVERNFTFGTLNSSTTALAGNGVILAGNVAFSAGDHAIEVNSALNTSTISGQVTMTGGVMRKTGPGTLVLSNLNNAATWTDGTIQVANGVLRNGATGAIPAGTNLQVDAGAVFDTPVSEQVVNSLSGNGVISNSSLSPAVLYVGGTSTTDTTTMTNSTFSGSISGLASSEFENATLGLTKVGAGELRLAGQNTFRGPTTVQSGKLNILAGGSVVAGSSFNVGEGATAQIDGSITAQASGTLNVTSEGVNPAILRGSGNLAINTTISTGGVLEPLRIGGQQMTINDHSLTLEENSTLVFTMSQAETGIIFTNQSRLTLPGDGSQWTLKLVVGDLTNPNPGTHYKIFNGDPLGTYFLNNNLEFTDDVGDVFVDFSATPGWFFGPNGGVHFDAQENDIYITGIMVPEPGAAPLLLASMGAALGLQRFRKRRK